MYVNKDNINVSSAMWSRQLKDVHLSEKALKLFLANQISQLQLQPYQIQSMKDPHITW